MTTAPPPGETIYAHQQTGIAFLKARSRALLFDLAGMGKALADDTLVATPDGPRRIADLRVGDYVLGSAGQPVRVVGVYPQGVRPCWRLRWGRDAEVIADEEHLWAVRRAWRGAPWRLETTATLVADKARRDCLPAAPVMRFAGTDPDVPAYLAGYVVGNGYLKGGQITCHADDLAHVLAECGLQGASVRVRGNTARIYLQKAAARPLQALLGDGLSREKAIPPEIALASVTYRLAFLQGLMDADGSSSVAGGVERGRSALCTGSSHIAHGVQALVWSLGGCATLRAYERGGRYHTEYHVNVHLPPAFCPFRLPRKIESAKRRCRVHPNRRLQLKEPVEPRSVTCIAVDAPDRLFTLANGVVTHNTAQALLALRDRMLPGVVVCPVSVIGSWEREVARWLPGWKVRVQTTCMEPPPPPGPFEVVITAYSRARLDAGPRAAVILDEAHLCKNVTSQRARRVAALISQARGPVWALTGTPVLRDPFDLWGLLELLGIEKSTYRTKTNFANMFGGKYDMLNGWQWSGPRPDAYKPLEHFMLQRRRSDCLDLPARTRETMFCELPKRLERRFQEICARYPADDPNWQQWATAGELCAALADLSAAKVPPLIDLIAELAPSTERPIVVFSAHKDAAEGLARSLGWPFITGSTAPALRSQIVDGFQAGMAAGLVCTIQAAGVGLTLTRASTLIFLSKTWVHAQNSQAEDRIYRIGQTRDVRVIDFQSTSPLESSIERVIARKVPYAFEQAE